jgi:hypothetical protein
MEREMAYTADVNRWRGSEEEQRYRPHMLESPWHPGWIAVTVLGFIIWWPIGLALLFFTLGSRKMSCWNGGDRWQNKMERMQWKMDRMRGRMERGGFGFGFPQPSASGNRAFDEYRMETLRRLEEEQQEFRDFLTREGSARIAELAAGLQSAERASAWIAGGLEVTRANGEKFAAEATLSRLQRRRLPDHRGTPFSFVTGGCPLFVKALRQFRPEFLCG